METRYTVTEATPEGPRLAIFTADKDAALKQYAALLPNAMLTTTTSDLFREGNCLAESMVAGYDYENETLVGWLR